MDDTAAPADQTASRRRGRAITALVLLVLGSLLLPLAGITLWVRNQVLSTDRYVETVAPLATDPAVQALVAERVSVRIIEAVDFEETAADLLGEVSPRAERLAPMLAVAAQDAVREAATRFLESDEFEQLWEAVNRTAHDQIVQVLTGREDKAITTTDGQVVLHLAPIAEEVARRVEDRLGIEIPDSVMERLDVDFLLFESADLASAQSGVRLLDRLAWITVVASLAMLVLSVVVAPDRRRGLQRLGAGMVVSMALTLVIVAFGRTRYLGALPDTELVQSSGEAVFDTLTRFVLRSFRVLLVLGLILLASAWAMGSSGPATRLRAVWQQAAGRAGAGSASVNLGPVPHWVGRHARSLQVAVVSLGLLVLVVWAHPTGLVVLGVAALTILGLAIIDVLRRADARAGEELTTASA